jgi:hypothetical protein
VAQAALPASYSQLVSLARRIESGQITAGTSRYRAPIGGAATPQGMSGFPAETRTCYRCNRPGHLAANCTDTGAPLAVPPPANPPANPLLDAQAVRGAPIPRGRCYTCDQLGHYSTTCPLSTCRQCGQRGHTMLRCPQNQNGANTEPLGRDRGLGAASS